MQHTTPSATAGTPIVPRDRLDFRLDASIPRYWCDGDAFKTRFFSRATAYTLQEQ